MNQKCAFGLIVNEVLAFILEICLLQICESDFKEDVDTANRF